MLEFSSGGALMRNKHYFLFVYIGRCQFFSMYWLGVLEGFGIYFSTWTVDGNKRSNLVQIVVKYLTEGTGDTKSILRQRLMMMKLRKTQKRRIYAVKKNSFSKHQKIKLTK